MKIGVGEPNTECAGLTKRLRITYYAKKFSQFADADWDCSQASRMNWLYWWYETHNNRAAAG